GFPCAAASVGRPQAPLNSALVQTMMNKGFHLILNATITCCLTFLLSACQRAPLKPDYGYPVDWPKLTILTKGSAELNGTYANQGIATNSNGRFVPITLASLIPRYKQLDQQDIVQLGKPVHDGSVRLLVLPAKKGVFQTSYPRLQAFVATDGSIEGYEIETASDENALLYLLQITSSSLGSTAASSSQSRVFLTLGDDSSLIAQIHSEEFAIFLFFPYYSSEYVWARFERIGN
ncbi:MAG: hypothetical protein ACU84Q_20475, partial [Gammaproteobacteria bacterium]